MLTIIDLWLLGRLEKLAHWWQKLTGKNCFWLARVAAICHGFIIVVGVVPGALLMTRRPIIAAISGIMMILALYATIRFLKMIKNIERIVLGLHESNLSNPLKVKDCDWRTVILFVILLCFFIMTINLTTGYFILYFSITLGTLMSWQGLVYYFSACDPLPQAKSRIKEWKEKFVNAAKGIFAPAPQPSPVPCE